VTADPHEHRTAGDCDAGGAPYAPALAGAGAAAALAGDRDTGGAPYAAALAALPGAGPAALVRILRDWTPKEAWGRIREGRLTRPRSHRSSGRRQVNVGRRPGGVDERLWAPSHPSAPGPGFPGETHDRSWREVAGRIDPPAWWAPYAAAGIGVTWPGQPDYPSALVNDPERPGVLFWRGDLRHLARPCVAVVGTRRATPDGRSVAFELGRDLAAAGVCVVSGLALGIDGAAHAGALSGLTSSPGAGVIAGPAGVAASGVDVPYPHRHAGLWDQVVTSGVMLSEALPGRPPQPWRFPARNRIIAGLAAMVVVVESHAAGGSLITAEAAIARGVEVRVVPGPVHSSASAGSNQLLYDGPGPVRHAQDVLDGLGIFASGRPATAAGRAESLTDEARKVLDALGWQPTLLSQVMDRTGLSAGAASRALDFLQDAGMVGMDDHWWVRRSGR
jgi:DNA processing protein